MEWQPIETCPKSCGWVLLASMGSWKAHIGTWEDYNGRACWVKDGEGLPLHDITHWMPLPAPPQEDRP